MAEVALAAVAVCLAAVTAAHAIKHWDDIELARAEENLRRYNVLIADNDFNQGMTSRASPIFKIGITDSCLSIEVLDKKVAKTLPKLKRLVSKQQALERKAAETAMLDSREKRESLKKDAEDLLQETKSLRQSLPESINLWFGKQKRVEGDARLPPSREGRRFCEGALLYQQGRTTIEKLTDRNLKAERADAFICTYCSMEVGACRNFRVSSRGEVLTSQDLLPASHLAACKSIFVRKAVYRCVCCYRQDTEVDFASASDLVRHMAEHANDPVVLREEYGSDALERDINKLLSKTHVEESPKESPAESSDVGELSRGPSTDLDQERLEDTPPPPSPLTPEMVTLDLRTGETSSEVQAPRAFRRDQPSPIASTDTSHWNPPPISQQRQELDGAKPTHPTHELMATPLEPTGTDPLLTSAPQTQNLRRIDYNLVPQELPTEPPIQQPTPYSTFDTSEISSYEDSFSPKPVPGSGPISSPTQAPLRPPPLPPKGIAYHVTPIVYAPASPARDVAPHEQQSYAKPSEDGEKDRQWASKRQGRAASEDSRFRKPSQVVRTGRPAGQDDDSM